MKTRTKNILSTLSLLFAGMGLAAQDALQASEEIANELPADHSTSFWVLVVVGALLFVGILVYAFAISAYANSGLIARKAKDAGKTAGVILLLLIPSVADAQSYDHFLSHFSEDEITMMLIVDGILLVIFLYMRRILNKLTTIGAAEEAEPEVKPMAALSQILTHAVAIEEEDSILMDHEYDGIRELDNSLPPWWLWGFYVSIVAGVIYMFHFHVFKTGDLNVAALEKDLAQAEIDKEAYLQSLAMNVDENTVSLLTGDEDLAGGKAVFLKNCVTCHGANGEGLVGPNFTDDYWLYGNSIQQVFTTIKYGAKRGMKAWDELNPMEMAQVASYIISLQGTEVTGGLAPEGDFYEKYDPTTEEGEEGEATEDSGEGDVAGDGEESTDEAAGEVVEEAAAE